MNKICFIIFCHCNLQNKEDLDDIIDNIQHFYKNCDFLVNHPTINHENIFTKHNFGLVDKSSFIFGAFKDIIEKLSYEQINSYNHFCLVSANQYFISNINIEDNVNYFQFYNVPNWYSYYKGKDTSNIYKYNALQQEYALWDNKFLYKEFNINNPMASNWESAFLTKEAMIECKNNISICDKYYPNADLMSLFPGYMALKTNQQWKFPAFFGTFDPSCIEKNHIITIAQVKQKKLEGYSSIKRVDYSKNCKIKQYIRENYYAS